jgi:uncharacterized protein YjbJ (UPF0337 family)
VNASDDFQNLNGLIRRINMKPSTQNEIEGKVHEVKGKIKESVGRLTKNPDLEDQGIVEKVAGKIQKKIGQFEKATEKR